MPSDEIRMGEWPAPGATHSAEDLKAFIRDIRDFPRPGIVFKDITPLLLDPRALDSAVAGLASLGREGRPEFVVAAEARGFILGAALARELGAGFVPVRKPGKLPHETVSAEYALEYGLDALEIHADALPAGARVLIHDDLLATGGTAGALAQLMRTLGAEIVSFVFLVELGFLGGRERLGPYAVSSLIDYAD